MRSKFPPLLLAGFVSLTTAGCVSTTIVRMDETQTIKAEVDVPEEQLLDIGVNVLEMGVPEDVKEAEKGNVVPGVRRAEIRFIPSVIKTTLQDTGHWGAVRVVPGENKAVHLQVDGTIMVSNGEELSLHLRAVDATGRVWLDDEYSDKASRYAYTSQYAHQDPFQNLYNQFANDLFEARQSLDAGDIREIRRVSELKFAQDIAPDAFEDHLGQTDDGIYTVRRLPAEGDPMVQRVQRILDREYMFIDTLDEHYDSYYRNMNTAYDDWRKYSYEETLALRRVRRSAAMLKILGGAMIIGGVMVDQNSDSHTAGSAADAMLILGAVAIKSGFDRGTEAKIHAEALRELGDSFEAEVAPLIVDVEGESVTLKGSVDEQYEEWRRLLREIYSTETGFPASAESGQSAETVGSGGL